MFLRKMHAGEGCGTGEGRSHGKEQDLAKSHRRILWCSPWGGGWGRTSELLQPGAWALGYLYLNSQVLLVLPVSELSRLRLPEGGPAAKWPLLALRVASVGSGSVKMGK